MNWVKGFALASCLAMPMSAIHATLASAEPAATVTKTDATTKTDSTKKPSTAEIKAMLAKCSDEADAKGLFVKAGKGAARKAYRRECMHKMGVDPK